MIAKIRIFLILCLALPLSACLTFQGEEPGPVVPTKGYYKVGKPYMIEGKKYYPKVNYDYDETGIASWYGPGFNGKRTANGEIFRTNELTAAHKTLPMPSIVRVTNLENGKSVVLRVNDRGPYSKGRLIDVSSKAAEMLGFKNQGWAKVRVQVLEQESKRIAQAAMMGQDTRGTEVAMNGHGAGGYQKAAYEPPKASATPATHSLKTAYDENIPGHVRSGLFYPDPVLTTYTVKPSTIYIQAGSFSSRENAQALSSTLEGIGNPMIHEVQVRGSTFYRVRIPANDADSADRILRRVIQKGQKNAIIMVE